MESILFYIKPDVVGFFLNKAVKRVVSLSKKKQIQTKAAARNNGVNFKRRALKRTEAARCPTTPRDGCPTWAVDFCGGEGEPFSRCYLYRLAFHSFPRLEQVNANYHGRVPLRGLLVPRLGIFPWE